jgi:hypothetical protein
MLLSVLLFVIVMLPLLLMLVMQLLPMFFFIGMFSPLIMPPEAYLELTSKFSMPLPISKPQDVPGSNLHYTSFEEAVAHPFSEEHQPSFQNRRRKKPLLGMLHLVLGKQEHQKQNKTKLRKAGSSEE